MRRPSYCHRQGFSLLELLTVVGIILVLGYISLENFLNAEDAAHHAAAERNAHVLNEGMERYMVAGGHMSQIYTLYPNAGASSDAYQAVVDSLRSTSLLSMNLGGPFIAQGFQPQFGTSGWRVVMTAKTLSALPSAYNTAGTYPTVYFDVTNDTSGSLGITAMSDSSGPTDFTPIGLVAGLSTGDSFNSTSPTLSHTATSSSSIPDPVNTSQQGYYGTTTTP